ncbi:hypothetical protein FACS189425_08150 [Clostridia bacterium]|nr:hypothetical protein FACS189425_08150 [Clostridia bacterium]
MNRTKTLIFNTALLTVVSIIVSVISMFFNIYIAKKIGAEAMGVFSLVMSVYMFAMTLAVSGIGLASTRLVAEELAFGRAGGAKRAARRCLIYALIMGTIASALLIMSAEFIGTHFLHSKLTIRPLIALAISLPFVAMSASLTGYFNAVRQVIRSGAGQVLEQFIKIFACAEFLAFLLAEQGLEMACFAIVLGGVVAEIAGFIYRYIVYLMGRKKIIGADAIGDNIGGRMLSIAVPVPFV